MYSGGLKDNKVANAEGCICILYNGNDGGRLALSDWTPLPYAVKVRAFASG